MNLALVPPRRLKRVERAEIPSVPRRLILVEREQAILARLEFPDHRSPFMRDVRHEDRTRGGPALRSASEPRAMASHPPARAAKWAAAVLRRSTPPACCRPSSR